MIDSQCTSLAKLVVIEVAFLGADRIGGHTRVLINVELSALAFVTACALFGSSHDSLAIMIIPCQPILTPMLLYLCRMVSTRIHILSI